LSDQYFFPLVTCPSESYCHDQYEESALVTA
jgi:hypothetical protein